MKGCQLSIPKKKGFPKGIEKVHLRKGNAKRTGKRFTSCDDDMPEKDIIFDDSDLSDYNSDKSTKGKENSIDLKSISRKYKRKLKKDSNKIHKNREIRKVLMSVPIKNVVWD